MATCKGKKKNGQPCGATAGADGYCFRHRPGKDAAAARKEASARGGKGGRMAPPTLDESEVESISFDGAKSITDFCCRVAQWVLSGQIDAKSGNCAILAASTALRSLDTGELEQRLMALEQQLGLRRAS